MNINAGLVSIIPTLLNTASVLALIVLSTPRVIILINLKNHVQADVTVYIK